jgi:glucosyl-3-phosphoglycerate synthase
MSFGILQSFFNRMQKYGGIDKLPDMNQIYKHFQAQDQQYQLVEEEIKEEERPPMSTIPEYRKKFGLDK